MRPLPVWKAAVSNKTNRESICFCFLAFLRLPALDHSPNSTASPGSATHRFSPDVIGQRMQFDVVVIGAGISGASAAFELAANRTVLLIEAEAQPGYHSTGRSAALYTPNYGNSLVRAINRASAGFFHHPPPGFASQPLLTPRGAITVAAKGNEDTLAAVLAHGTPDDPISPMSPQRALELAPLLRPDRVAAALYEPGVMDMDVAAIHQGYLNGFKARGGQLILGAEVFHLERNGDLWTLEAGEHRITATFIVNAAGGWADRIGALAGATALGLVPKRRTAVILEAPGGLMLRNMPSIDFAGSDAYLKPDGGRIMASPGDATPVAPHDVQPDDYEVAVLVDWVQTETKIVSQRPASSWAGLRSFFSDGSPVAGFDPGIENFFWLAGQGGYGIMMAPALAIATAALMRGSPLPPALRDAGIKPDALAPARLES
jgi:D-arginine dehydrogenase